MKNDLDIALTNEEYFSFPVECKSKLATFLSTGRIDIKDATREDVKLFHSVSTRIRFDSLKSVCDEMEKEVKSQSVPDEVEYDMHSVKPKRTRTQSTGHCNAVVRHEPLRWANSGGIIETSSSYRKPSHYFLMVGSISGNQMAAIAYNVQNRRIVQNDMKLEKGKYIKEICSGYLKETPYLFAIISSNGKGDKLKRYDIIESKWKTCAKMKQKLSNTFIVAFCDCIYCFGGETTDILRCSMVAKKWTVVGQLKHKIVTPVYTEHVGKLYIFEQNSVQIFTPFTGHVTETLLVSFVATGFAFSFRDKVCILSENSLTEFDPSTGSSIRREFPCLSYRPLHAVFVKFGRVFALISNTEGRFEICCSSDLAQWTKQKSFPKTLDILRTETIECACPFAPFENDIDHLRKCRNAQR